MNIEYPAPEQIPQLRSLWKKAFGDEDDFLDKFYSIAYSPDRCRCITIGGETGAALYWFETVCENQRFAYVYAVATDPEFRNQGLCRLLMEDVKEILKKQGYDGILLYPASEALAGMYRKMGYKRCTHVTEFQCEAAAEPVAGQEIGAAEYLRRRRELLPPGSVLQEGVDFDLLASQADFYAGEGWIAAVTSGETLLHCHELLGNVTNAPGIVRYFRCEKGFFRTVGSQKSFAMMLPLAENCKKPAYFGFPLD